MNLQQKIGQRIIALRKIKGMSQQDLAWSCDPQIDRCFMCQVENGKTNASIQTLSKIIDALETDFTTFFNSEIFN